MLNRFIHILSLLFISLLLPAQNLEKIGKKDMVKVNGGLNLSTQYYNAHGMRSSRDPFTWYLNGNVNVSILDVAFPFSYSYTNNQGKFTQPFNMTSCTPTYKWVKAYIGQTTMNFSPYTMAGHLFTGAGLELSPGKFRFASFYGRLQKAVDYDFVTQSDANMAYQRMGYGIRMGYEGGQHALFLNWLSAGDDPNSLSYIPPVSNIHPQQNNAFSISGKTTVFRQLSLEAEYGLSALNSNTIAGDQAPSSPYRLILLNAAAKGARVLRAMKGTASYRFKLASVGISYERVDPDYATLGAYFFNNDMENIALTSQFSLFKGKVNVSMNNGVQHNNLNKDKLRTSSRLANSVNISYAASSKFNLSAAYSDFSAYTRNRPVTDPFYQASPTDTLNFYQVSKQGNLTAVYMFGAQKTKQSVSLTGTHQVSKQQTGTELAAPVKVSNANAAYNLTLSDIHTTLSLIGNMSYTQAQPNNSLFYGPGLNVSKSFLKNKLRMSVGSSWNKSMVYNLTASSIINNRMSVSYSPEVKNKKYGRPSFSFNASQVNRGATATVAKSGELVLMLNAGYSF